MKPPVELEHFRKLDLRVGTVSSARAHPAMAGLSILTVLLEEPAEVLAPASFAEGSMLGSRVVVAIGLHPLSAGGLRFTGCLVPVKASNGKAISATVAAPIPNGSRLS